MASLVNRCAAANRLRNCYTRRCYHLFTKSQRTTNCSNKEPFTLKELSCCNLICNQNSFRKITTTNALLRKPRVDITFVKHDGQKITATGRVGDTMLDVVVNNDLDLKGYGACEGTLSCSTCHLIFKEEDFNKMEERATDEELDMLDLALDISPTSRLGCQVTVTKDMHGVEVKVPANVRDIRGSPSTPDTVTT